ncbi:MAG TPA: hypothetical protein PK867_09825 [Pirellulales bacterium]|nr:hypothetical protein [Pirellulales bacterium]
MAKRLESRLQALERRNVPEARVFLTRDEAAVWAIAIIGIEGQKCESRQSRGEPLPVESSPKLEARRARLLPMLLRASDRVRELRELGQLETVVESIKAKGVWRDEWSDQEPAGEVGSGAT